MNNRNEITYFPVTPKRKNSALRLTDLASNNYQKFTFSKPLGEGTYGYVRLFVNGDEKIAVKAPKDNSEIHHLNAKELKLAKEKINSEFKLLRQAYPDNLHYSLHHYEITEKDGDGYHHSYRMTVPFIAGKKLDQHVKDKINSMKDMANLMLSVALELQRIHDEGIIHGDIGARNILVDEDNIDDPVHLLDFGMAYPANGYATVNFESSRPIGQSSGEMAPERFPNVRMKAHPSQDVYSLAKTLNKLLKLKGPEWKRKFTEKHPSVKHLIENGALTKDKRPDLQDFIRHLKSDIDWSANLPPNLRMIAIALENVDTRKARRLLQAKPTLYTAEKLAPLLHNLIKNKMYDLAESLMHIKKGIPLDMVINGDHILHLAASDPDIEMDFFNQLLASVPKKLMPAIIDLTNTSGETVLHAAAKTGRVDLVIEILKHEPYMLISNRDDELAVDVAHPDVEPVLNLFTYIAKLVQEHKNLSRHRLFDAKAKKSKEKILDAAHFLQNMILIDNKEDLDQLADYQDIIANTPKLEKIYQSLVEKEFLASAEENGFDLFGMLPDIFNFK